MNGGYMQNVEFEGQMSQRTRRGVRKHPIKPGYIVALEFSAIGGVKYERELVRASGNEAEVRVTRTADNADLLKDSKSIIGAAYYIMDRTCVNTPIGYYADEHQLEEARLGLVDAQRAAKTFNEIAEQLGSDRRVTIDLFPMMIEPDNDALLARLARLACERLQAVKDALRAGDRKEFEWAMDKARNVEHMATGVNADAVRLALHIAKQRKSELLEDLRRGSGPELAGARLDLKPLDAAMALFVDASSAAEEPLEQ